ncbi:phosphoethanolamine transferase [Temperatibacter marinus]|uniref:Phosphoethanolamine transferase n=1 Tax=Temperatibacter marinus TaxID=1456591 RepID=A0AA52H9C0_9PROT|nr:phosphoethanolamine transferase [Temperatibacter marinus]WND02754.1 phosphoethanolamine transferase [Temperatibacter marinus]
MNYKLLILPLTILTYCILINLAKFDASIVKGLIHIAFQSCLLLGLFTLVKRKGIRLTLALVLSAELFTQLTYQSSLSVSLIMSLLNTSLGEVISFISYNSLQILTIGLFLFSITAAPSQQRQSISYLLTFVGILYVFMPLGISSNNLFSSDHYKSYLKTGMARGFSERYTKIEYAIHEDIGGRLPAIKSIRGIMDSLVLFSRQVNIESSWSHVTSSRNGKDLLVIGIGEALRADNLGIYGYSRQTTPLLSQRINTLDLFKNTYAAGTNTWSSIPAILTKMNQTPDLSKSIINLAKDAGYTTYWISNHAKVSRWDFSVSALAGQADHSFFFSTDEGGEVYDEALLKTLKTMLVKRDDKSLFILHFYGSHMSFEDRYPKNFSKFRGENSSLDRYDNSILYTDYVQDKIIDLVAAEKGKYLFFADHGLTSPEGKIPLRHDVRKSPDPNSLKVPFFTFPKEEFLTSLHEKEAISLYYFECIFSRWAAITAPDLQANKHCETKSGDQDIQFLDSNLKLHTISSQKKSH